MAASATGGAAAGPSCSFFVCHEGKQAFVQLPVGPYIQLAAIWREDLLSTAVNRGAVVGIKKRGGELIPMSDFSGGAIPATLKDGEEYELVLSTSGIPLSALLALVSRKTEDFRRRRPMNRDALAALQKRLAAIFSWDTCPSKETRSHSPRRWCCLSGA